MAILSYRWNLQRMKKFLWRKLTLHQLWLSYPINEIYKEWRSFYEENWQYTNYGYPILSMKFTKNEEVFMKKIDITPTMAILSYRWNLQRMKMFLWRKLTLHQLWLSYPINEIYKEWRCFYEENWQYTNYGNPILSMKFTKNEEVFMKKIDISPTMAILSYRWNLQRMKKFLWRKLTLHQLWLSYPIDEIYKEWRCFYEENWHFTNYGYPILSMKFTKNEEVFMKKIDSTPTMAILSYRWNLQRMKMFLWRKLTLHQIWLSYPINEIYKEWRCFYEENWHFTNYGYPILSMKFTKNEDVFMKKINITPTMAILSYRWNLQRMKKFLWRKLTVHQLWLSYPINEIYKEWRCFYEENWHYTNYGYPILSMKFTKNEDVFMKKIDISDI
jgi:tmRNA-binding protein